MIKGRLIESCIASMKKMQKELEEKRDANVSNDSWETYYQKIGELEKAIQLMTAHLEFWFEGEVIAKYWDGDFMIIRQIHNPKRAYELSLWIQLLCEEVE